MIVVPMEIYYKGWIVQLVPYVGWYIYTRIDTDYNGIHRPFSSIEDAIGAINFIASRNT